VDNIEEDVRIADVRSLENMRKKGKAKITVSDTE